VGSVLFLGKSNSQEIFDQKGGREKNSRAFGRPEILSRKGLVREHLLRGTGKEAQSRGVKTSIVKGKGRETA